MSGVSEQANRQAGGPVFTSQFLVDSDHGVWRVSVENEEEPSNRRKEEKRGEEK